jgi:uncharacterized membrane protein YeaQ/YmgE (transglycosylase-associated protein family)
MHFLLFIAIGLIAGALASRVVSGHSYGMVGDLLVGVLGAILGGWLFGSLGNGGMLVGLVTAFIGAIALLWVVRLLVPARV